MKRHLKYSVFCFAAMFLLFGCTTSKNTWLTRSTNSFTTRFNIFFNGYQQYKDGIAAINKAQKDNYSQLLPMYPISRHSNADAAKANMDVTIEKCRKAIKQKSIKAKPKKNSAKRKDPAYIAFMNKEEYNPMVVRSWLLLADAEFHKADFLGAMGTYTYIFNHFGAEADVANEAQIGRARCFAEMGWNYEAEDALNKVSTKTTLNKRINGLYAAASADLFMKEKRYADAIPFLKTAADNESSRYLKSRFYFILGQLSAKYQDTETAFGAFSEAIKASTTYDMELAAKLQRAQVAGKNTDKVLAELKKMAKSPRNKDYADQINVVIGNIYLNENRKDKAIESYLAAIHSKNPDNPDKMTANIRLGDFYYTEKAYLKAQPCYAAATKQIKPDNEDFERVTRRADVLNELAGYSTTVQVQDSLQRLGKLPENDKLVAVNKLIAKLKKEEQDALVEQTKMEQQQQYLMQQQAAQKGFTSIGGFDQSANGFNQPSGTSTTVASGSGSSWYFYNPATVQNGIAQFRQTWGTRSLEDNWRRTDKASIADNLPSVAQKTTDTTPDAPKPESDKYNPSFYLAQLPSKPEDFVKSNDLISKALFNMGQLYEKKLEENSLAIATYEELYRRFGVSNDWIDAYYALYNLNKKAGKGGEADKYKGVIIANFPESLYGKMLAHPEYAQRQQAIEQMQDSLYEATFMAYTRNDYQTVMNNYKRVVNEYPFASLMPKFSLLNALSTGKNGDQTAMKTELEELIKTYPQSDVVSTVKDMLALMNQGKTVTKGATYGNLIAKQREEIAQKPAQALPAFTATLGNRHLVVLPVVSDTVNVNRLLYKVAAYNFKYYVLKDFDLEIKSLSPALRSIVISDFPTFEDARYYLSSLSEDTSLSKIIAAAGIKPIAISEENLKAIMAGQTLDSYLNFYQNTLIPAQIAAATKK